MPGWAETKRRGAADTEGSGTCAIVPVADASAQPAGGAQPHVVPGSDVIRESAPTSTDRRTRT